MPENATTSPRRYRPVLKIASGGMGAVYLGFHSGAAGFHRPVAIKRAHAHLLEDPQFREMLITESRLASMVRHPNVVGVCDVEEMNGELLLIMDYVEGASLFELMNGPTVIPPAIVFRIVLDICHGLYALHSTTDSKGKSLGLVHRDVSPHNILVGLDGVARIADFGIAKACESAVNMTQGLRGKPGYMAPEYIKTRVATSAADIFALGVVAWEAVARRRLFKVSNDLETLDRVCNVTIPPPSSFETELPADVEQVILRAIARSPKERHATAAEFAAELETALAHTPYLSRHAAVGEFVRSIAGEKIEARRRELADDRPNTLPPPVEPEVLPAAQMRAFTEVRPPLPPPRPPAPSTTGDCFDVSIQVEPSRSQFNPWGGNGNGARNPRRKKRGAAALIGAMTLALAALGVQRGLTWEANTSGHAVARADDQKQESAPPPSAPLSLPPTHTAATPAPAPSTPSVAESAAPTKPTAAIKVAAVPVPSPVTSARTAPPGGARPQPRPTTPSLVAAPAKAPENPY